MKLKKFIREYMYEDWYLANLVPQEMMTELSVSTNRQGRPIHTLC